MSKDQESIRALVAAEILSKISAALVDSAFLFRKGGRATGSSNAQSSGKAAPPSPAQSKPSPQSKPAQPSSQGAPSPTSKGVTFQMPTRPPQGK